MRMPDLTFTFGPEDLAAFHVHVANRPAALREQRLRILLLGLALPPVVLLLGWGLSGFEPLSLDRHVLLPTLLPLALVLVMLPFLPVFNRRAVHRRVARFGRRAGTGVMFGPTRLSTTAEGIVVETPETRSLYAWPAVQGIEETPDHLFVMLGADIGVVVPRQGQDANTLAALHAEVARNRTVT
jgi:hypothetical protein